MNKLFFISMIVAVALLISCNQKQSSNAQAGESSSEQVENQKTTGVSFYGTYEGVLPCADCSGIKIILTLRDDSTYDLSREYLETTHGVESESGVYSLENDIITLITPSSREKTYYKILDSQLALVDESGVLNQGELAEHYILNKKAN